MPNTVFKDFIERQLALVAASTSEQERRVALMQFFHGCLSECAEKAIDAEMRAINGEPFKSHYQDRIESTYYPYNCARRSAYSGFTNEQRQVLHGLAAHTAFSVLDSVFVQLAEISEHYASITLQPHSSPEIKHALHARNPDDDNWYWSENIPQSLSKYEY